MKTHELKTWPHQFQAVWDGAKLYELRENDRDFRRGDLLVLQEWMQGSAEFGVEEGYTSRAIVAAVTYITTNEGGRGPITLPGNLVVMSIRVLGRAGCGAMEPRL